MKFTNSPFAILDKNMNALDYQKRNLIKESIRSETIERVAKCKEWTKEAIPKIVL